MNHGKWHVDDAIILLQGFDGFSVDVTFHVVGLI